MRGPHLKMPNCPAAIGKNTDVIVLTEMSACDPKSVLRLYTHTHTFAIDTEFNSKIN